MLERLVLRAPGPVRAALAREFPGLAVEDGARADISISAEEWRAWRFDPYALDAALRRRADRGPLTLAIDGPGAEEIAIEVVGRCQRFIGRRNPASAGRAFDRLIEVHRTLHDLEKPLVRADYEHALDTWQWLLRLDGRAGLAPQAAALFHDAERLLSEADARVEHEAPDHQAFKEAHARRGAALARGAVLAAGLSDRIADRVAELVAEHERPRGAAEATLVADADALSFFSLNSHGFFDYFGREHTRRKVAYSLGRLSERARARLDQIRCRPEVSAMISAELSGAKEGV